MNVDEAKKLLLREQAERIARCQRRLQELLEEEQCKLEPVMILTKKGITASVTIVPLGDSEK